MTKLVVLQDSSKLFNPLGIVSPVSVHAKLLMQQLSQRRIAWDEPLNQDLQEDWTTILADICKCAEISIDRRLFTTGLKGTGIKLQY